MLNRNNKVNDENVANPRLEFVQSSLSDEPINIMRIFNFKASYSLSSIKKYTPYYKCCGIKKIEFLNPYIGIKSFIIVIGLFVFFQSALINGFVNASVAPIETRYGLSSFESSAIASMYEIGNVLFVYPVTYFGGSSRKSTWLSYGSLVFSFGSLTFSLPQFISGKYSYYKEDNLCNFNLTKMSVCDFDDDFSKLNKFKYFFYGGMFLMGIGGIPLYTLGYNYVDENCDKYESTVYIAILNTIAIIGPAFGFVGASLFSNIYVDFEKGVRPTDITTRDSHLWIGAYWLPFLMVFIICFLISIPLMWFPSFISQKYYERFINSIPVRSPETGQTSFAKLSCLEILNEAKEVIFNIHFLLLAFISSCEMFILASLSTMGSKFLINRYNVDQSLAGIYIGLGIIPSCIIALSVSAFTIKRLKLKSIGLTRLILVFAIIPIPFILAFLFDCKSTKVLGISETELQSCSNMCQCSRDASQFSPICGHDGQTYFSPCLAGCIAKRKDPDKLVLFENCSCITTSSGISGAKLGTCDSDCNVGKVVIFILAISLLFFCIYFSIVPVISLTLTCVRPQLRPVALGIQWCFVRILGTLPGPPLTGLIFDNACEHHLTKCGTKGNCSFYDQNLLTYPYMGMLVGLKILNAAFIMVLWFIWNPKYEEFDDYGAQQINEQMGGIENPTNETSGLVTDNHDSRIHDE